MSRTATEPIQAHWNTDGFDLAAGPPSTATATEVNERLARIEVADLGAHIVPYLAAATAELALLAGKPWRLSADDPPVALLRMIAKVTMRQPHLGGPHTARLLEQLG